MTTREVAGRLLMMSKSNESRVLGALITLNKWGECVSWDEMRATLQESNADAADVHPTAIQRGIHAALAKGTLEREQVGKQAFAYRPGPRLAELVAFCVS